MEIFASDCVEDIQNKVNLSLNAKKLLDIGGSHGLHSIAFCKKYPQLEATIFDLPASLARTEETICHHNLQERIRTQAGNALTEDIGSGYNAILFFSLIHNHSADENRALLKKIFQSLAPGGMIIIHDYMRDQMDPSVNASFNLTLFLETGTSTFSFKEVSTWLTESGFEKIQKADLEPLAKGNIITAIKPGYLSDSRL